MIRIDGELTPVTYEVLTPDVVRRMIESILTDEQKARFIAEKELESGLQRSRVVAVQNQRISSARNVGTAVRVIPASVPSPSTSSSSSQS